MRSRRSPRIAAAALALVAAAAAAAAAEPPAATAAPAPQVASPNDDDRQLVVAIYEEPPFTMRGEEGDWSGLSVDLWHEIANRRGLDYRFAAYQEAHALDALVGGEADVAVGPLVITAERKLRMDFTPAYLSVAFGIASRPAASDGWLHAVRSAFTGRILFATLALVTAMFVFGVVMWLIERRRNPDHFGGNVHKGIGEGLWWSATTMTTVGYGDRTPITFWGRAIGIVWMIVSVIAVSMFTAVVTSVLTVQTLNPVIRSIGDLTRVRSGAVDGSSAADFLAEHGIAVRTYDDPRAGLDAVAAREIDAFIDEYPVLAYVVRHEHDGQLVVVAVPNHTGFVAFGLPLHSPIRQPVDVALLEVLHSGWWREQVRRYLGPVR